MSERLRRLRSIPELVTEFDDPQSVLIHAVLYLTAALFAVPYLWMVTLSFQTREDAFSNVPHWIPPEVTFRWYRRVLFETLMIDWMINTILVATATTFIVLVVDSLIAFSLTRLEWTGRRAILAVIMASFMVPGFVNIIPLYSLITDLGLINNYLAVILPFAAGPLGVFLLVQFFRDIPDEIQEAARLDGFSPLQIYTHIILPLSKPVMTALGLFTFVWSWNQYLWPLIVLQSEKAYTLPIGVVTLQATHSYEPAFIMAAAFVASVPLFVLFLFFQDHLVEAVAMQGTTG